MKMTDLQPGETGIVSRVKCGHGAERKLSSRGIKIGSRVRMVSASRGPVVLECGGSQTAIGRGMAKKIEVKRR
ncbi:MAG: ferrous iron transport protein A [Candidatus Hadarchaeia archaeon]